MTCNKCKWWEKNENGGYKTKINLGECRRAKPFWEQTEWNGDEYEFERVLKPECANDLFFVQDGSDYMATLLTRSNFSCKCFEKV